MFREFLCSIGIHRNKCTRTTVQEDWNPYGNSDDAWGWRTDTICRCKYCSYIKKIISFWET